MKASFTIVLLAILLSGCVGTDAHRPTQKLSIRVNGEQSMHYTLFLVDEGSRVQFKQANGIHTTDLPGTTYGVGLVFFIPVSSNPEKRESVLFTRDGDDVDMLTVRRIREAKRTSDGVYLIHVGKKGALNQ